MERVFFKIFKKILICLKFCNKIKFFPWFHPLALSSFFRLTENYLKHLAKLILMAEVTNGWLGLCVSYSVWTFFIYAFVAYLYNPHVHVLGTIHIHRNHGYKHIWSLDTKNTAWSFSLEKSKNWQHPATFPHGNNLDRARVLHAALIPTKLV